MYRRLPDGFTFAIRLVASKEKFIEHTDSFALYLVLVPNGYFIKFILQVNPIANRIKQAHWTIGDVKARSNASISFGYALLQISVEENGSTDVCVLSSIESASTFDVLLATCLVYTTQPPKARIVDTYESKIEIHSLVRGMCLNSPAMSAAICVYYRRSGSRTHIHCYCRGDGKVNWSLLLFLRRQNVQHRKMEQ